jgi:hypothetical protein
MGDKGGKGRVGALKGPVEDVGEKVVAWNGGGVFCGDVEIGRAPCPAPDEVCGWRARRMSAGCFVYVGFDDSAKEIERENWRSCCLCIIVRGRNAILLTAKHKGGGAYAKVAEHSRGRTSPSSHNSIDMSHR